MTDKMLVRPRPHAPRALPHLAVGFLAAVLGCRGDDDAPLSERRVAAVSDAEASALGFEALGKWSVPPGSSGTIVGLHASHTQGERSLEVAAQNYAPLTSVSMSSLGAVGSLVLLDLMLPTEQANPWWYGAIQMYANAPSVGVYNAYLGQIELTGLPLAKWLTIPFQLPGDVATRLSGTYSDLTFTIAINVPYNQTGSYLLDNIRFAADITPILLGIAQNSAGVTKAVVTYQTSTATDVYIPYGPSNSLSSESGFISSPPEMPPQWFVSREHSPFAATIPGSQLTWKVGNRSVTATTGSTQLPTETAPDGSRIVTLPDGSKFNIDVVPPQDPPPASEPPVSDQFFGALSGQLTVGPTGAAIYTVPLASPPPVAGIGPNLSLVYNSQGGDGIAGQGWEVAGLSMVHRCPKTAVQDANSRPISLDSSDGLCLDGKRLFDRGPVFDNGFGQVVRYEAEIQDFSVIEQTPYDSHSTYFSVRTKTGETRYYGLQEQARVNVPTGQQSTATVVWALDRVMDEWGNFYTITYNHGIADFSSTGIRVTRIDYTGHVADSTAGAEPTFAFINFTYEDRTDVRSARFRDATLPRTKRLKTIETQLGSYTLEYEAPESDPMLPTRLARIRYCSLNGADCLKPLEFGWEGGGYEWVETPAYRLPARIDRHYNDHWRLPGTQFIDLNSDGRLDFVQSRDGLPAKAWENTPFGWIEHPTWALPASLIQGDGKPGGARLTDIDGDGALDLISNSAPGPFCENRDSDDVRICSEGPFSPAVYLNRIKKNEGWVPRAGYGVLPSGWGNINFAATDRVPDTLADMNGDGRADLVRFGPGEFEIYRLQVLYNTGTGWAVPQENFSTGAIGPVSAFHLEDINRDGLADLVGNNIPNVQEQSLIVGINAGENGQDGVLSCCTVWRPSSYPADPNADAPGGSQFVGDVDGDGFHEPIVSWRTDWTASAFNFRVVGQPHLPFATGRGYSTSGNASFLQALSTFGPDSREGIPFQDRLLSNYIVAMADINGDGLADMILNHQDGGQLLVNTGTTWKDINNATGRQTSGGPIPVPVVPTNDERFAINGGWGADGRNGGATFIDLDGDGITDLVEAHPQSFTSNTLVHFAWLNKFRPPIITKFPNGLARQSEVLYEVITTAQARANGTYGDDAEREAGTTYLTMPMRVVASVSAEDGRAIGTLATTRYKYENLRGSASRRGPQGFKRITVTEPSGMKTVTTYAQVYPYTGLVTSIVRSTVVADVPPPLSGEVVVTETSTTYCDRVAANPDDTPSCTPISGPGAGAAYPPNTSVFVYPLVVADTSHLRSASLFDFAFDETLTITTTNRYNVSGNPVRTIVTTLGDKGTASTADDETFERRTDSTYNLVGQDPEQRERLTRTKVRSQRLAPVDGNNSAIEHTTDFEYSELHRLFPPRGLEQRVWAGRKTKVEPDAPAELNVTLHTAFGYDRFGNVTSTTNCASDFDNCGLPGESGPPARPFRKTVVSFDPADFNAPSGADFVPALGYLKGRFPVKTTNPEGHAEFAAYEPLTGALLQKTDANGIHTCYRYDPFGSQNTEITRCGSAQPLLTTVHRFLTTSVDPTFAKVVTVTRPPVGGATWLYTDAFGRTVSTRSQHFNGGFTDATTSYDPLGRVASESKAHLIGDPSFTSTPTYDPLGRVTHLVEELGPLENGGSPTGLTTITANAGSLVQTTRTINGQPQTRQEVKNAIGKLASTAVVQVNDTTIAYKYDADGNLTDTIDPAGNLVHLVYDVRSRKISSSDPDLGSWSYVYNGFGDLVSQTDAKNQTTTMKYDRLGRMTSKTELTGTPQARTAEWVYDLADGAGIGKLTVMVSAPDARFIGTTCGSPHVGGNRTFRSFRYTQFGDVEEETQCVDGESFVTSYQYDSFGRQSVVKYPTVNGRRLAVEYHYTALGYLHYVSDLADGSIYWAATAMNALGQVTTETLRNGVETTLIRSPSTGWLLASESVAHADGNKLIQKWSYGYDEAGNLRTRGRADAVNTASSQETFVYDPLNRLRSSRVTTSDGHDGTQTSAYDSLGNISEKNGATYAYNAGCAAGSRPAGPHAVCTVAGGNPFQYDGNGNMTEAAGRTLEYNPANKVTHIESDAPSQMGNVDFMYGADANRVVQQVTSGGSTSRTLYVGLGSTGKSLYERTTRSNGVEHAQFIYAGGGRAIAICLTTDSAVAMRYYHVDHLGSVTAMSDERGRVLPATGANASVLGYDPWGARRSPEGRPAEPGSFNQQPGRREFTGHESIPSVGLVNMNGRVYDPVLGRFLSPDPNVQFVADLQSYNRYSYVLNNPLRLTDPTGYFSFDLGKFTVGLLYSVVTIGACATPGAQGLCAAALMATVAYSTTTMRASGAGWDQVILVNSIGLLSGIATGGLVSAAGGGLAATMIGGAISGGASAAITTSLTGGGDLGWNALLGAAQGAAGSALAWSLNPSPPVSRASAQEAQGGNLAEVLDPSADPSDALGDVIGDTEANRGGRGPRGGRGTRGGLRMWDPPATRLPRPLPPVERMRGNPLSLPRAIDPLETPVFRGGATITARPTDVRLRDGLVQPTHGPSLNSDPASLTRFGGAYRIESLPSGLHIIQRGVNPHHFEIVPFKPVTLDQFQQLLDQVRLTPH